MFSCPNNPLILLCFFGNPSIDGCGSTANRKETSTHVCPSVQPAQVADVKPLAD